MKKGLIFFLLLLLNYCAMGQVFTGISVNYVHYIFEDPDNSIDYNSFVSGIHMGVYPDSFGFFSSLNFSLFPLWASLNLSDYSYFLQLDILTGLGFGIQLSDFSSFKLGCGIHLFDNLLSPASSSTEDIDITCFTAGIGGYFSYFYKISILYHFYISLHCGYDFFQVLDFTNEKNIRKFLSMFLSCGLYTPMVIKKLWGKEKKPR